jgi:hypothetical protein
LTTLSVYAGEYLSQRFTIKEDGVVKNVSSYTISFSITRTLGTSDTIIQKTSGSGIDMTNASSGIIDVTLTVNDTKALDALDGLTMFYYDLRGEIDSKPEVWLTGQLHLKIPAYIPE